MSLYRKFSINLYFVGAVIEFHVATPLGWMILLGYITDINNVQVLTQATQNHMALTSSSALIIPIVRVFSSLNS